jgi:SAM-dependent methyltransferase
MQAYGQAFARVYNEHWGSFAAQVAPRLLAMYEATPLGQERRPMLDLCCGTGQLALRFLERGYRVTGLDLSESMLAIARQNASEYIRTGQARFVRADVTSFALEDRFGLVTSTFDALNHLDSLAALRSCVRCVFSVLEPQGLFMFDLNTRKALEQRWNGISITDTEEAMIVTRGLFDAQAGRAWTRISGFVRNDDGHYERFEETVYNTAYEIRAVIEALREAGWDAPYAATMGDFSSPTDAPEEQMRVFVVAQKPAA